MTLSPRETSGRNRDVGGAGRIAGVQMEYHAHILTAVSFTAAVYLHHDPILSYKADSDVRPALGHQGLKNHLNTEPPEIKNFSKILI